MVSTPPPITMGRGVVTKFFLHLWQDKPLLVELKYIDRNIYYYITTLSLFHFFRNSQHPAK